MEISKLIEKKFGDKYNYLKLLECIYDKSANSCTFVFMYPESFNFENENDKKKFVSFIQEICTVNCKVDVKFKKSYLDEDLIVNKVLDFFSENHRSIKNEISYDDIEIVRDEGIIITLYISTKMIGYIEKIQSELKLYLEENFFSSFNIITMPKEEENDGLYDLEQRIEKIENDISKTSYDKTKRYTVNLLENVSGRDFSPKPEYIGNIEGLKSSIILSGIISNLNKKSFIAKRGRNKGKEKYFLTFNLDDGSGNINCIYFISKTAEKKAFTICNGSHLAVLGDMQKGFNGKITLNIKSCYFCIKIDEEEQKEIEEQTDCFLENLAENNNAYKFIFPSKYIEYEQDNLFTVPKKYADYIMKNSFVVYDIETTGLDHNNCDITEIGAVKIEKGVITETFQTLIKPHHEIPDQIVKITNITNEMVENCMYGEDLINDFYLFCKGSILSGYNVINFDQKFISKLGEKVNLVFDNEILDVMKVAQQKLILSNYTLATVVKNLNINLIDAHRALNDAIATAKALLKLYEIS